MGDPCPLKPASLQNPAVVNQASRSSAAHACIPAVCNEALLRSTLHLMGCCTSEDTTFADGTAAARFMKVLQCSSDSSAAAAPVASIYSGDVDMMVKMDEEEDASPHPRAIHRRWLRVFASLSAQFGLSPAPKVKEAIFCGSEAAVVELLCSVLRQALYLAPTATVIHYAMTLRHEEIAHRLQPKKAASKPLGLACPSGPPPPANPPPPPMKRKGAPYTGDPVDVHIPLLPPLRSLHSVSVGTEPEGTVQAAVDIMTRIVKPSKAEGPVSPNDKSLDELRHRQAELREVAARERRVAELRKQEPNIRVSMNTCAMLRQRLHKGLERPSSAEAKGASKQDPKLTTKPTVAGGSRAVTVPLRLEPIKSPPPPKSNPPPPLRQPKQFTAIQSSAQRSPTVAPSPAAPPLSQQPCSCAFQQPAPCDPAEQRRNKAKALLQEYQPPSPAPRSLDSTLTVDRAVSSLASDSTDHRERPTEMTPVVNEERCTQRTPPPQTCEAEVTAKPMPPVMTAIPLVVRVVQTFLRAQTARNVGSIPAFAPPCRDVSSAHAKVQFAFPKGPVCPSGVRPMPLGPADTV